MWYRARATVLSVSETPDNSVDGAKEADDIAIVTAIARKSLLQEIVSRWPLALTGK